MSKVFHFHVKYHVTRDLLVSNRCRMAIRQNVEGNAYLLHLLCDSIHPEGVAILAVQGKGFLNILRDFYAKLVGPFEIAGVLLRTREIIWSHFLNTWGTHQLKAGSWSSPLVTAYSAVSIG